MAQSARPSGLRHIISNLSARRRFGVRWYDQSRVLLRLVPKPAAGSYDQDECGQAESDDIQPLMRDDIADPTGFRRR